MDQADLHISAEEYTALLRQPGQHRLRQRSGGGDRHHAQHQRGKEDAKTRQPAAQFAPRQPPGEGEAVHALASALRGISSATIAPSLSRTMRSQRPRQHFLMRDEKQRRAFARMQREQKIGDVCARHGVEIAGRLVGEQHRRARGRWRGPAPRAAARRPTIARDNDRRARPARPPSALRVPGRRRRPRPPAPAARPHFPAPSWSGSDESSGTRCRHGRGGNAPAHPRPGPVSSVPATRTRPALGASSPAATIRSEDLPDPEGPSRASV